MLSITRQLVTLVTLTFLPSVYASFKCFNSGSIKSIHDNEEKIEKVSFCINHSVFKLISFDCLKNRNCNAINNYKNSKSIPIVNSIYGNPLHVKCDMLKGNPKLVEYYNGKKWIKTSICKFNDESFISVFNKI